MNFQRYLKTLLQVDFFFDFLQLCEQRKCQEEVFILALNYMDRHLRRKIVPKTSLQLLASACLLLASKLREPSCKSLSADVLVYFTDSSITKYELIVSRTSTFILFIVFIDKSHQNTLERFLNTYNFLDNSKQCEYNSFITVRHNTVINCVINLFWKQMHFFHF